MKMLRSVLSLLLVAVLLLSMTPNVFAEEKNPEQITESDTYVYGGRESSAIGGKTYQYQYFSLYSVGYNFNGNNNGADSLMAIYVYNLYNVNRGKNIPAYCMDIHTTAVEGSEYRRLNLEDSSYSAGTAGLVRAILQEGFYLDYVENEDTAVHKARVQEKLDALGMSAGVVDPQSGKSDLTLGEAITATQCAIWRTVHGSILTFPKFLRSVNYAKSTIAVYGALSDEEKANHIGGTNYPSEAVKAYVAGRIQQVYDYLLSLEPVEAVQKTLSPAAFTDLHDPVVTPNADGTYDITVTTTVDVDMTANDTLVLKARLGNTKYTAQTNLSAGEQTVTLTITGVPEGQQKEQVMLSISGYQTVEGYFLFDAKDGRGTSQTMVAYDNSRLPVYAEVKAQESRIFNVYKTTNIEVAPGTFQRYPLSGITFDLYSMKEEMEKGIDMEHPENYLSKVKDAPEYSVTTDRNGRASLNFTHHGMEDGVYLVVERNHPSIVAPIDPFFLIMPAGDQYEITIKPKNDVKGLVRVEKDVLALGNNTASLNVGQEHTWIIGATIPDDLINGRTYEISDTLDNRLDFLGNVRVQLETVEGAEAVLLTADTDYVLEVTDVTESNPNASFTVTLTTGGKSAITDAIGENRLENYMLRVYFDARINANAEMGTDIPNQAELKYINSVNITFDVESDTPTVSTGAVNLRKVDAKNHDHTLPGAIFEIYRLATQEEVENQDERIRYINGVNGPVIRMDFYDNATLTGQKVTSVTTDEEGCAAICGLAYGVYYLVETQAPEGYNPVAEPMQLTIDASSHLEEKAITIENVGGTVLPATGGMGTGPFTSCGVALMCLGAAFLLLNKRRMAV